MARRQKVKRTADVLVRHIGDNLDVSFSLVNMASHGQPLVYVNDHFTRLTGYEADECIGRNCRFLQGADTKIEDVSLVRRAILRRRSVCIDLLNYTKYNSPFFNRLILFPLLLDNVPHYAGLQLPMIYGSSTEINEFNQQKKSLDIQDKVSAQFSRIFAILHIQDRIGKISTAQTETLSQAISNIVRFARQQ